MRKKILWLVVSGLMALSLVMAACGPAAVEEEEEEKKVVVVEEEEEEEEKEVVVEEEAVEDAGPKYGGTLTLHQASDLSSGWDDVVTRTIFSNASYRLTNEPMWITDWTKGAAGGYGTGETDLFSFYDIVSLKTGLVAESWEWSVDTEKDEGTVVYQVRQGIHWALNPASEASRLVGGRELTADDVVYSLRQKIAAPRFASSTSPLRDIEVTETGPWEVTLTKIPPLNLMSVLSSLGDTFGRIVPPEVVEKYGDMADWENSVGSGPFMIIDYIPGSQVIMERNANYWMKDPIGPGKGNQLPYIDGLRFLIIPDVSTQHAALRVGKLDRMKRISAEDVPLLMRTSPDLLSAQTETTGPVGMSKFPIQMRQDGPPFDDIRVRQAMLLAIDFDALNQGLYDGLGQILTWPFEYIPTYSDIYIGLDAPDLDEEIKELYTYDVEKARQLLSDAGYPDGFKVQVVLIASEVDFWAIIKDYLSKLGVDLEFRVMESGARTNFLRGREHTGMTAYGFQTYSRFYSAGLIETDATWNLGMISDPFIDETMDDIRRVHYSDEREAMRMTRELSKYVLAQSFIIPIPYGPVYTFWWPWLKNYAGEDNMGFHFWERWAGWVWIDEDLKKSMGY